MCNPLCLQWFKTMAIPDEFNGKDILEVGSRNVNGSVREFFTENSLFPSPIFSPKSYTGLDIVAGNGVDVVASAYDMVDLFGKEKFDVVISTCALEHMSDWKGAIDNMKDVLKIGGMLYLIVPSNFVFHCPPDYWRWTQLDLKIIFSDYKIINIEEDSEANSLIYLKCQKLTEEKCNLDNINVRRIA